MFIPMILSLIGGITLNIFSVKSIKNQGANFFGIAGCIVGLVMVAFAIYLALPNTTP